jgi:tetratricopeptide (TPR) repeat protein
VGLATSNIFISYRREDSAAYAGRLCDHLTAITGANQVFMDVEAIAPGQNFAERIDQTIGSCSTVLVIVGPRWKTILLERMQSEHEDYVRHEIERALARKTRVIPVLVGGAVLAELSDVPAPLAEIGFHQAIEIRDASFRDDCDRLARLLGLAPLARWRSMAVTAGVVLAVLLLLLISVRGVMSWRVRQQLDSGVAEILATAQTQTKLGEYEAAYRSATQAVKRDPDSKAALDEQVNAAMRWLEHFSVVGDDASVRNFTAGQLSELLGVLDGELARTNGKEPRSADILAHIGWAHWLNQKLAEKEFGSAAEDSLRQALVIDPGNVYANAMLGNWLLQHRKSTEDAMKCFAVAVSSGRERALVREMQLGGMLYNDSDGVPVQAVKMLNDMRKNNEPLADGYRSRFMGSDFSPTNSDEFLNSVLTAVPPDEALKTYEWLDQSSDSEAKRLKHDFMAARVLELEGKEAEAVAAYTALQPKLVAAGFDDRIKAHVADSLVRLKKL